MLPSIRVIVVCLLLISIPQISGKSKKKCYSCTSDVFFNKECNDHFSVKPDNLKAYPHVTLIDCSSGWCGKMSFKNKGSVVSTTRMCVPKPPDDKKERCVDLTIERKTVDMCFCKGDLCNAASFLSPGSALLLGIVSLTAYLNLR